MTPAPAQRSSATIFADASFDPKTRHAGWAAWMVGNGLRSAMVGGKIDKPVAQSHDAETFAAVNALYAARGRGYFVAGQTVMLQSDCIRTLNVFASHVPGTIESRHADGIPTTKIRAAKLKTADKAALKALGDLMAETPIRIIVRHVRGHQKGHGRAWVNEQCDKLAKRHMRDARRAARRQNQLQGKAA